MKIYIELEMLLLVHMSNNFREILKRKGGGGGIIIIIIIIIIYLPCNIEHMNAFLI
jgi:hypothetical protein